MTKQKLWELIEAYRTSGGSEEHHARKERLDAVLDELLEQPAQHQEPAFWTRKQRGMYREFCEKPFTADWEPLYTSPPASKPLTDGLEIKVKRELFRFHSEQDWVNKAQSRYANCGVRKGYYITVDAAGHVMHIGLCFKNAAYPVTCYELQTNWRKESSAHGIGVDK